jgi:hypothetical protein
MAWGVSIKVHCERAPGWKGCRAFAKEVKEAEDAVSAQFQAHVCSNRLKCCTNATQLLSWVENHVYGNKYPDKVLPISNCRPFDAHAEKDPVYSFIEEKIDKPKAQLQKEDAVHRALCGLCEQVCAFSSTSLHDTCLHTCNYTLGCVFQVLEVRVVTHEEKHCRNAAASLQRVQPLSLHERVRSARSFI